MKQKIGQTLRKQMELWIAREVNLSMKCIKGEESPYWEGKRDALEEFAERFGFWYPKYPNKNL